MDEDFEPRVWLRAIEDAREETTAYYLHEFSWRGLTPPEQFEGPRYYPPALQWRVPARLDREARGTGLHVELVTSIGDLREFDVAGTFVFTARGSEQRLIAYSPVPAQEDYDYLFVPFRDSTSGSETYGGGRYLDVLRREGDDYFLDFNLAYNPSCAYSPRYNCPYPPAENELPVAVEAGEKIPFLH